MSGAGILPPHGIITPDDHSAYLNLAAYVSIVMTLIFVTTRLIMRNLILRTWHSNDYFILSATVGPYHFLLITEYQRDEIEQWPC